VPVGPGRRLLDVAVSLVLGLVFLPVLALVAVAVRADGSGPVLFRQVRTGQGGRPFTLLKFRTMRAGPRGPEVTGPQDPRITRVGRLLRRSSLDELPQLLNVLRGEMTLVGPRPETPGMAARYPGELRWVFQHRPGLTGPAQVRLRDDDAIPPGTSDVEGWYLEHLVPARVALDAEFLARPSLGATVRLLGETAVHLAGRVLPLQQHTY
jgi:lipopolysaccharide/colanic/teichoic acid biosynthesis glycosyltransferase